MGALWQPDEFPLKPQARVHSRPVPETIRILGGEIQEMIEDCSQIDPHLELGVSLSQTSHDLIPDETSYKVT